MTQDLESTVAGSNLLVLRIDAAKLTSLTIGKLVHGLLSDVESISSVIDSCDVDGLAVIGNAIASTALFKKSVKVSMRTNI